MNDVEKTKREWADVVETSTGVFSDGQGCIGDGLRDYETCKTAAKPGGVEVEMRCRSCGGTKNVLVEYQELIPIAYNVAPQEAYGDKHGQAVSNPTQWAFSNVTHAWWPQMKCVGCGTPVGPMFTAREAAQHVKTAEANAWINPLFARKLAEAARNARARASGG